MGGDETLVERERERREREGEGGIQYRANLRLRLPKKRKKIETHPFDKGKKVFQLVAMQRS